MTLRKNVHVNPHRIQTDLFEALAYSNPPSYFSIVIKSGLRFKYLANSKEDAILKFINEQKKKDLQHAESNNYKVKELDYKGMIIEIEELIVNI